MESRSTHGLRLDQLADLLRAAVAEGPQPQDKGPKPEDGKEKPEDGKHKTEDGPSVF